MRIFLKYNLRRLGDHPARTALSLSGVAVGAALVVAVLGLFGSLTGSVAAFVRDVGGVADLEVGAVSDEGVDQSLVERMAAVPGVEVAAPIVRGSVVVRNRKLLLIGADGRLAQLDPAIAPPGEATPAALFGVLLPEDTAKELGLREGSPLSLNGSAGEQRTVVGGLLSGNAARVNDGRIAAAHLVVAQRLLGKEGRIDSVLILASPGQDVAALRDRLAAAAGTGAWVDTPERRVDQARATTRGLRLGLLMGVAMALVTGGFVVYNTMSMAALERRRELATLRALGGRRIVLLRAFLMEAFVIGLIGSGSGALVGLIVSRRSVDAIPAFFGAALGVNLSYHLPGYAIAAAIASGAVVAAVAAWIPARRAVDVPPADAMRPEGVLESLEPVEGISILPAAGGLALGAIGFTAAVSAPSSVSYIGLAALMLGSIFATYGFTRPITRAAAFVAGRMGVAGRLAEAAVERAPRRAWASTVAVVTAVGMVVAQGSVTRNLNDSIERGYESLGRIDLYVSSEGGDSYGADVLMPAGWRDEIARIPGVANVGVSTLSFINFRGQRVLLQGVSGSVGAEPSMALVSPETRRRVEAGEGAIVSTRFNELYGTKTGGTLRLPSPTGIREIEIVAAVPSFTWERGMVTIGSNRLTEWFGRSGVSDFLISFEEDADPAEVRTAVQRFANTAPSRVYLNSGSEYVELIMASVGQVNSLFQALASVVIVAAVLAILNALLISVLERRRELGIMRALGTSRRQLRRMVAAEAAAIAVVGGVLGLGLGLLAHRASLTAIGRQGGIEIGYRIEPDMMVLALLLGVAMAVLGGLEPARRAGMVDVTEAIGYE